MDISKIICDVATYIKINNGKIVTVCEHCSGEICKALSFPNPRIYAVCEKFCMRCDSSDPHLSFYNIRLRKPILKILRGIPGAGKSTIVREILIPKGWKSVSADEYFIDPVTGAYRFVPSKLQVAHDECFLKAVTYLEGGKDVVVDNTNRTLGEFSRYTTIKGIGYTIQVTRVLGNYGSTKELDDHVMARHRQGYEVFKGETTIRSSYNSEGKLVIQERKY